MKGEPIRLFRRPSGQRARNRNISRYQQEIETSADVVLRPMTSSAHHQHQHYWSWGEVAPILDWIYLYRMPLHMIRDWNEDFLAIKLMNPYEDDIKDLSILTFIKQGWEGRVVVLTFSTLRFVNLNCHHHCTLCSAKIRISGGILT